MIVPAYNEGAVLERHLARLTQHLRGRGETFELVCVDDGSTDATAQILARQFEPVRVLSHHDNRGKGAAVRSGALASSGERIVFLDADLSTDLAGLEPLLAALDAGADVALGSRRVAGARIERRQPRLREGLGRAFSSLARALFAPEVRDFTCGFKGFRRQAARAIFERARVERWAFDVELVVIARALGLSLVQVPVSWTHHGGSKVRVPGAVLGSLRELASIARRRWFGDLRR